MLKKVSPRLWYFGGRVGCLGAWPKIGDTKKIRGDIKAIFEPLPKIFEKLRTIGTKDLRQSFRSLSTKTFLSNKKIATEEIGFLSAIEQKLEVKSTDMVMKSSFLETRFQQLGRWA